MMPGVLAVALAGALAVPAAEDPQLAGMRSLAARMLKGKPPGADSAYCEYMAVSQVDGCSGSRRNALRHRIGRKGTVETWVYRSPGEGGGPVGYYRGRITERDWRSLLESIGKMRMARDQAGIPGPPPPGPTEAIPILALADGGEKAEFGRSGHASGPVGEAFDRAVGLARNAKDTVWQLSLANPEAEVRGDSVRVTAEWRWRGPAGVRILFSRPAEGDLCGTASFKWFLDTSEFSADWRRAAASPGKGGDLTWELPGAKAATVRLVFPYHGPKGKPKAKRVGMLDGIGIRLVPGGSGDTIQATVSTGRFEF